MRVGCSKKLCFIFIFSLVHILVDKVNTEGSSGNVEIKPVRNPRIFFPLTTSTSTVTRTASIWTVCFRSTTTAVTACGRRKRMIEDVQGLGEMDLNISPSNSFRENGAERDIDSLIEDGINEEADSSRDPRFMIYWTTIVTTSYTTSYTASSFIASVTCTPSGFPYKEC